MVVKVLKKEERDTDALYYSGDRSIPLFSGYLWRRAMTTIAEIKSKRHAPRQDNVMGITFQIWKPPSPLSGQVNPTHHSLCKLNGDDDDPLSLLIFPVFLPQPWPLG